MYGTAFRAMGGRARIHAGELEFVISYSNRKERVLNGAQKFTQSWCVKLLTGHLPLDNVA